MYNLFKLLHIAAAIVWVGGGVAFHVMNTRATRQRDADALAVLAAQGEALGRSFFGPAAMVTLLAGVAAVIAGDWSFASFWISYGFAGVFASIVVGAVLISRATKELTEVVATDGVTSPRAAALQKRIGRLGAVDLTILFSVVAVMVYKP